jgi:hypothetical protein
VEKRGEVCDTIMDTIEATRCSQRGFVLSSFKEVLLEAMMETIYKIIQGVNEGELKKMTIILFQCIRCFQDKLSTHHTARHMSAAAGVYVPPTPDTILTPVEEEGRDGLGCILRPNVSLAPHVIQFGGPTPWSATAPSSYSTEILAIILDSPFYILFLL